MKNQPNINGVPVPGLPMGGINKKLGFITTSTYLKSLDIQPVLETSIGIYWAESDVPAIMRAIAIDLLLRAEQCNE